MKISLTGQDPEVITITGASASVAASISPLLANGFQFLEAVYNGTNVTAFLVYPFLRAATPPAIQSAFPKNEFNGQRSATP